MTCVGHDLEFPWHFTYFHGLLEREIADEQHEELTGPPDLVMGDVPVEQVVTGPGEYDLEFYGRQVKGFFIPHSHGLVALRGIIVDPSDERSMEYGRLVLKHQPVVL